MFLVKGGGAHGTLRIIGNTQDLRFWEEHVLASTFSLHLSSVSPSRECKAYKLLSEQERVFWHSRS